jgi:hypothetical protein
MTLTITQQIAMATMTRAMQVARGLVTARTREVDREFLGVPPVDREHFKNCRSVLAARVAPTNN